MDPIALVSVGCKARSALIASAGLARPLRAFPKAPYFEAGGEIIWLGHQLAVRHPRAVITSRPVAAGEAVTLGVLPELTWRREFPPAGAIDARSVRMAAEALLDAIFDLSPPRGFGALLVHAELEFPLSFARAQACRLAQAYAESDPESVLIASRGLLGLGAGLTPSGDDLVAAALFGRRLIDRDTGWARVGCELAHDAKDASHAISAALLADTVAGESFEPLHDLADALAAGDEHAALAAARDLVRVGHSSGWDMLAGFLMGILGERISKDV